MKSRSNSGSPVGILDFFPRGLFPREGQRASLLEFEASYDSYDVFVVEAPTGAGKEAWSKTAARWAASVWKHKAHIAVPTNMLVEQGSRDGTFSLKKKHEYRCSFPLEGQQMNCEEGKKAHGKHCSGCPYVKSLRMARALPYQVSNFYTYMAHKLYAPLVIFDEAHLLKKMLQDLAAKKLWYRDYRYPHNVRTYEQLHAWAETAWEESPDDRKLTLLVEDLRSGRNRYLIEKGMELLRGKEEPVLLLKPIDTSAHPPVLWPPQHVKKIVLLSATIGPKDLEQLGVSGRRVKWIRVPSPIPAERRPVVLDPICHLSYGAPDSELDKLAAYIEEVAGLFPNDKGLVHLPYSLVDKIAPRLSGDRYLFHNKWNKMERFAEFRRSKNSVLVCSGLYEGIDLPDDEGRFQVLGKIPWGSLADSAIRYMKDTDPERYVWETLVLVMQGAGRIVRGPTDRGYTFCPDASSKRLRPEQFLSYFNEALRAGESLRGAMPEVGNRTFDNCRALLPLL